ncbi:thiamine biosynthesis lipoprotein [Luteibacter sp. Sphag1AF]|uniref:FAD:protein FMN transferase n=1 Tax=Luteibacter sp. Sphag1AF TaxID=2587031 RepID=UPI001611AA33|nr:FAD:protein FMN transferase [Luteibacter sp. Sphag1AF]MBB3225775.1 thiamine biosynthesis lipoprotein [Luteibacter sp. Sphag1AF]
MKRLILLCAALLLPFVATATDVRRFEGEVMGTTWSVNAVMPEGTDPEYIRKGIQAEVDKVDLQMSTWKPQSDLSRFNNAPAGTWQVLPPEFFDVLTYALQLASSSGGAYDPTVGPLVNLWGFGPDRHPHDIPTPEAIAAAKQRVGWQRITLDPAGRRARQPGGVYVDLSSVAKGYSVDQVARWLDAQGVHAYLVEVGGELRAHGRKPDGSSWHVGIERPGAASAAAGVDQIERIISLDDRAIATSGDYRHFFETGGKVFSHHIDPRTGYPVKHRIASVSIIAADCMHADSLGTTMTVLGPEDGMAYATQHDIAVLFVIYGDNGFEERMSPAFAAAQKP